MGQGHGHLYLCPAWPTGYWGAVEALARRISLGVRINGKKIIYLFINTLKLFAS